jgi:hypothetical protein
MRQLCARQLNDMANEEFNGVPMFNTGGGTLSVRTSEDGSQSVDISVADLDSVSV